MSRKVFEGKTSSFTIDTDRSESFHQFDFKINGSPTAGTINLNVSGGMSTETAKSVSVLNPKIAIIEMLPDKIEVEIVGFDGDSIDICYCAR